MQLFLIILASIMTATLNAQALSKSKIFFPFAEYGKAPFYAEVVGHVNACSQEFHVQLLTLSRIP